MEETRSQVARFRPNDLRTGGWIASVLAGVAVGFMAGWMAFAWIVAVGIEALEGPKLMAALAVAAGLSAALCAQRLIAATWQTGAGRCFAVAVLALFTYLVIGLSEHLMGELRADWTAGLGGITVLVFLRFRYEILMVPKQGPHKSRETTAVHRVMILGVVAIGAILAGEFLSLAIDPSRITAVGTRSGVESSLKLPLLGSIIFTPVFEEISFRGVLLMGLRMHLGGLASAGACSVLFALFHPGDAPSVAAIFVRSFVWSIAVLKSGSLAPAIAAHAVHNVLETFYLQS